MTKNNVKKEIMELTARYSDSPLDWVMFAFPWDSDPTIQICELQ